MSIAPYHRMKYVRIICSKIKIVYRNIYFHIDIYTCISKFINNILFFLLQNVGTSDSRPPAVREDVQEQKEDEEDNKEDLI